MWQSVFELIATLAVITNAALMVFTAGVYDDFSSVGKTFMFVGFQWACFTLQFILAAIVPDIPEAVDVQVARALITFILPQTLSKTYSLSHTLSPAPLL